MNTPTEPEFEFKLLSIQSKDSDTYSLFECIHTGYLLLFRYPTDKFEDLLETRVLGGLYLLSLVPMYKSIYVSPFVRYLFRSVTDDTDSIICMEYTMLQRISHIVQFE